MLYKSEHITIAHIIPEDAFQVNKLMVSNAERFMRFLPKTLADNQTLESTQAYIQKKMDAANNKTEFLFTIKDHYSIQLIGLVILKKIDWQLKQGEFAYCIGKQFKGKSLMGEAIQSISIFATEELGLKTLQIITHKTNLSSVKVATDSGFKWKKTLVNEFTPLNEPALDMELYELKYEG